jgi:hypothetical protein
MKPASNKNKPEAAPAMAARAATIARDTVPLLARQISTVRLAGGVFWKRRTPTGTVCTISATKTPTESRTTRRSCRGSEHGFGRRGPAGPRGLRSAPPAPLQVVHRARPRGLVHGRPARSRQHHEHGGGGGAVRPTVFRSPFNCGFVDRI